MDPFDRILCYVLLAVLTVRPLISETFQPLEVSFLEALPNTGGPTPMATAWLDWITLTVAVVALARRGRWLSRPVVGVGMALLAVAVALSISAAGDKSTALLAGANLVIAALAGLALSTLLTTRGMRQLLLAALLATGATSAIKCLKQQFSENPLVAQQWEAVYKPKLVQQGFDPQDPLFVNFERRMKAGEVFGFLSHPNIEGSCLMMWGLAAAGVLGGCAAAKKREHTSDLRPTGRSAATVVAPAVVALLCLGTVAALWFTKSRGAAVAGVLGLAVLIFLGLTARWTRAHAKRVLVVLIAGYLAIIGVGLTYGLVKGTLPTASLAFRWQYWTAAARALRDAPWTGLGRENFAYAYMLYKTPEATEEVRNPHNLWVSLLVELGPLGLTAGVVLCGAALLGGLRNLDGKAPVNDKQSADVRGAVTMAIGVVVLQAVFSGTPVDDLGGLLVWLQDVLLPWPIAMGVALWVLTRAGRRRWDSWVTAGLCAALVAAFVHGLVDFALLTPGGVAVFVLCAAGAVRLASVTDVPCRRHARAVRAVLGAVLTTPYVLVPLDLVSTTIARTKVREALRAGGASAQSIEDRESWVRRATELAGGSTAHNPLDTNNYIALATAREALARVYLEEGRAEDAKFMSHAAADAWEQAVARYPTNPRTRISCGRAWFAVWQQSGDADAARRAREHFTEALQIDDCRPVGEVMRLREKEREAVTQYLQALARNSPPTTRPGSSSPDSRGAGAG